MTRTTAGNSGFCASAASGCSNQQKQHSGFGSGLTNIAKHWFLIFIFIKSRASVTGGRNSNATPAQSPNVDKNYETPHELPLPAYPSKDLVGEYPARSDVFAAGQSEEILDAIVPGQ